MKTSREITDIAKAIQRQPQDARQNLMQFEARQLNREMGVIFNPDRFLDVCAGLRARY